MRNHPYHGGALNGKDCEKILMDVHSAKTVNDCVSLSCIDEEEPEKARGYLELFRILANVWQALRHPPADEQFNDDDLNEIISYCQAWSKILPIILPDRNITRKGHVLSYPIPEYLRK